VTCRVACVACLSFSSGQFADLNTELMTREPILLDPNVIARFCRGWMPKVRTIPKLNSGEPVAQCEEAGDGTHFSCVSCRGISCCGGNPGSRVDGHHCWGVPEHVFTTPMFRLSAFAFCLGVIGLVRRVAPRAFAEALVRDEVEFTDFRLRLVSVSPTCKHRQLVILHMRLTGFSVDTNNR
jgi:hypothetical protein